MTDDHRPGGFPLPRSRQARRLAGLAAEARIAARLGLPVAIGGGTATGAAQAAERLAPDVSALLSFGLAGGLDPDLAARHPPGPRDGPGRTANAGPRTPPYPPGWAARTRAALFGDGAILATAAAKAQPPRPHRRCCRRPRERRRRRAPPPGTPCPSPSSAPSATRPPATFRRAALVRARRRRPHRRVAASLPPSSPSPASIPALIALGRDAAAARHALVTRVGSLADARLRAMNAPQDPPAPRRPPRRVPHRRSSPPPATPRCTTRSSSRATRHPHLLPHARRRRTWPTPTSA